MPRKKNGAGLFNQRTLNISSIGGLVASNEVVEAINNHEKRGRKRKAVDTPEIINNSATEADDEDALLNAAMDIFDNSSRAAVEIVGGKCLQ